MTVWVFGGVVYPTRSEMCRARRVEYARLIVQEGLNFTQAAIRVGVSKRTGKVWRNGRTRASGRNEKPSVFLPHSCYGEPMVILDQVNPRFFSQAERIIIADMRVNGSSIRSIARTLKRSPSSVSREIKRNTNPDTHAYEPYRAHQVSAQRRKRPKPRKIYTCPGLWDEIYARLKRKYSPEQISHDLVACFPDNKSMRASTETIYQALYLQAKGQLRQEIIRALRKHHPARQSRSLTGQRTPRFRDPMVNISQRPASVEDRAIPGHWEGDLICGAHNQSAIGTLVERSTRFTLLLYLPNGHTAGQVQDAIIKKMRALPKYLRNSLTWDQGSEMALHKNITTSLDMTVYFCDPHSPWQRGSNENTNGLLRQYFPKGTDLSGYSEKYLDAVAEELNDRPRKTLNWAKPSQKILEIINNN